MSTPVHDDFETELRTRLRSATAQLEPALTFDEVVHGVVDGPRAPAPRRTWARAGAIGLAAASLVAVLVWTVRSPDRPSVSSPSTPSTITGGPEVSPAPSTVPGSSPSSPATDAGPVPSTDGTAATDAVNILVVGVDNNACVDPDSGYAAAFGDREGMGERSDTIMIMRVDPSTERAAVLSFPRDLWVSIAGRSGKNRINSAYVRDNPTRLLGTISDNFGIEVDHFIQIDFCAFKTIVDGLGGVAVPFAYPARDVNTGLFVPEPGCFTFDGDHALAYVSSRRYEYMDESGKWKTDPASELGRVSRQQDFLRRVLHTALDRGITDPSVARSLISAAQDNLVVDQNLTLGTMFEYVSLLASLSPDQVAGFRIEATEANVGGNSVLIPQIEGDNMQAVLALFGADVGGAGSPDIADGTTPTEASSTPSAAQTTPTPEENPMGLVPPREITC